MSEKYWYEYFHRTCPLCGDEKIFKERKYTEKPKKYSDRHKFFDEAFCSCFDY